MWPLGQVGANPPVTGSDGLSGDGTACAVAWLECRAAGASGENTGQWELGVGSDIIVV